ncbi:methyltransferase domain-containing protein [Streptomyces sp. NBC_00385]|uniref:methyltransferase domain-containing protein n=1 Tax=Streptomyces sp. NBC_00385 TaxID=2975733 RepID=UPI002DDB1FBA|nr:methyltransferase domain-containing protein [Streptomyces sp. NBC_00385]WRZ03027.1 hypothetical protein OG959_06560 [Streptomyces sp. NBC_00385]
MRLLDLATGSGYSAALACHRLGDDRVTTLNVDLHLTQAAAERLDRLGWHSTVVTTDATKELPGTFDRIVSMVSVPRIPRQWLTALEPEGRLVTTIAGTGLIITADKNHDGGATGRVANGTGPRSWPPARATTARPPSATSSPSQHKTPDR